MSCVLHFPRLFARTIGLAPFHSERPGGGLGRESLHTGHLAGGLGAVYFVASANFPHEFVARGKYDDAEQGEDKTQCRVDVPSAEDDTEVGSIPREEHLAITCQQLCQDWIKRVKRLHAFMLHIGPLAGMLWPIWS